MRYLIVLLCCISQLLVAQEDSEKLRIVDAIGLSASLNAVADEAVIGGNLFFERDMHTWQLGRVYGGIGLFYGELKSTDERVNKYADGKAILFQPIQVSAGHQLFVLNQLFGLRTEFVAGLSTFKQKIGYVDDRYDVNRSFSYSQSEFTVHAKTGISVRLNQRSRLEVIAHLPIVNDKIAPLGIGLGLSRRF